MRRRGNHRGRLQQLSAAAVQRGQRAAPRVRASRGALAGARAPRWWECRGCAARGGGGARGAPPRNSPALGGTCHASGRVHGCLASGAGRRRQRHHDQGVHERRLVSMLLRRVGSSGSRGSRFTRRRGVRAVHGDLCGRRTGVDDCDLPHGTPHGRLLAAPGAAFGGGGTACRRKEVVTCGGGSSRGYRRRRDRMRRGGRLRPRHRGSGRGGQPTDGRVSG